MTETNYTIFLSSQLHTRRLGTQIARQRLPQVVALSGPLGSGKTCLVQGIGEEMGVCEPINSPSFTLINEYRSGSKVLYHVDLYRLAGSGADAKKGVPPADQGGVNMSVFLSELDEILQQEAMVAIEWAELLQHYLPVDCLQISLSYVKDGTARKAVLAGPGSKGIAAQYQRSDN